LIDLNII
jgi:hypothetical protein